MTGQAQQQGEESAPLVLERGEAPTDLRILVRGAWTLTRAGTLDRQVAAFEIPAASSLARSEAPRGAPLPGDERGGEEERRSRPRPRPRLLLDLSAVTALDTSGAWLIDRLVGRLHDAGWEVEIAGLGEEWRHLLELARHRPVTVPEMPPEPHPLTGFVADIGEATVHILNNFGALLTFFGVVVARFARSLFQPRRFRFTSLVYQMEMVGLRAMAIVGLISFLIGAVVVNQGAVQLEKFGAEVLVSDLVGISVLRELGILLTAVILAGRSGSSFTAQIGSMVLHEEVDAMRALGLDPVEVLVIPRLLAMVLTLPLLTFYADIMGLLGGGLMAWGTLDIDVTQYLTRLQEATGWRDFAIGLIKAVFFAVIISVVGCFHGLVVERNAESVGRHTTTAVVEAIFMVIVLDAFFAVFFTTIGW
ncbi:MAG: MlaE family lipid ABC transporter permease subunit [Alphaproteobacteria bacterium]|nr:MAG: MlaE family lipid ABC transporter permease subunit [Alphaproteobacteria bacterium]